MDQFQSFAIGEKIPDDSLQVTFCNISLTLFMMGFFGNAHRKGGGDKGAPSVKYLTYILQR